MAGTATKPQRARPRHQRGGWEHRARGCLTSRGLHREQGKNAQGLKESVGPGSNRAEGEVRATPLPRTNRAPCAKYLAQKNLIALSTIRLKLLKRDAFGGRGLPTAAVLATFFQMLIKGRDMTFVGQSLERGILKRALGALEASRNGLKSTSRPPEFDERRPRTARAQPEACVRRGNPRRLSAGQAPRSGPR